MAQSVERLTRNEKVAGSIPAGSLHQKSPQNLVDRGLRGFLHVKNGPIGQNVLIETAFSP